MALPDLTRLDQSARRTYAKYKHLAQSTKRVLLGAFTPTGRLHSNPPNTDQPFIFAAQFGGGVRVVSGWVSTILSTYAQEFPFAACDHKFTKGLPTCANSLSAQEIIRIRTILVRSGTVLAKLSSPNQRRTGYGVKK